MSHHNNVQRVSSSTAHPLVTCRFVEVLQRFADVFQTVGLVGPAGRVEVAATLTTTEQRSAAVASEWGCLGLLLHAHPPAFSSHTARKRAAHGARQYQYLRM